MATRLDEALTAIDSDPDVWAGVISGGAARAFCAGADLKELAAGRSVAPPGREEAGLAGVLGRFVSKPMIAAVNGPAFGGGTELALACDLVVAATEATFALPEVQRGIMAAAGGLVRLPRQVPLRIALEAALTGQPMTAEAAERWGLVNRVVARDEVLPARSVSPRRCAPTRRSPFKPASGSSTGRSTDASPTTKPPGRSMSPRAGGCG